MGLLKIVHRLYERIIETRRGLKQLQEILGFDVSNQFRFEAPMYSFIHGMTVGIVTNPTVVMSSSMKRLRTVSHIMTEEAGIVEYVCFHRGCVGTPLHRISIFGEGESQPLIGLNNVV